MQLSLFEDTEQGVDLFEEEGFTLERTFNPIGKSIKLESTLSVRSEEKIIMYLQENSDSTFNTFSFNDINLDISLEKAISIAQKLTIK